LELGANIEEFGVDGRRPLAVAVVRQNLSLVQLLLANGAFAGVSEENSLWAFTPLHRAADLGSNPIVQELLKNGADANAQGARFAPTPLQCAVVKQHLEVATTLILAGADVEAGDRLSTPLHDAVNRRSVPLVKLLLDNGANPDGHGKSGLFAIGSSPRQRAERADVPGMMDAFTQADIDRGMQKNPK
jgi:ankyrin repeat protein